MDNGATHLEGVLMRIDCDSEGHLDNKRSRGADPNLVVKHHRIRCIWLHEVEIKELVEAGDESIREDNAYIAEQ